MFFSPDPIRIDAALKSLQHLSLFEVLTNGYDLNIPRNAFTRVLLSTCERYIAMSQQEILDGDRDMTYEQAQDRNFQCLKADVDNTALGSPLFFPAHRKYRWIDYDTLGPVRELRRIRGDDLTVTSIIRTYGGGSPMEALSRTWAFADQPRWRGFLTELTLIKCEHYLQPLHGTVIPPIIGVFANDTHVMQMFELPQETFWIEASPDMPEILKERCITALQLIHNRGVLHGNLQLHNFIITARGHVYVMDYRESRALVPEPEAEIGSTTHDEIVLEMRKLHFLLDYRGCRRAEPLGMESVVRLIKENENFQRQRARGELPSVPPKPTESVPIPEPTTREDEDLTPLPSPDEWEREWIVGRPPPSMHIVPTQSVVDLFDALLMFLVEGCQWNADVMLKRQSRKRSAWPDEDDEDARPTKRARVESDASSSGSPSPALDAEDEPYNADWWGPPAIVRGSPNAYQARWDPHSEEISGPAYFERIILPEYFRSYEVDLQFEPNVPRVGRVPRVQHTSLMNLRFRRSKEQRGGRAGVIARRKAASENPVIPLESFIQGEEAVETRIIASPRMMYRRPHGILSLPPARRIANYTRLPPIAPTICLTVPDLRPYLANLWLYQQMMMAKAHRDLEVSKKKKAALSSRDISPAEIELVLADSTVASEDEQISADEQTSSSQEESQGAAFLFARGFGSMGFSLLSGLWNWWSA